MFKYFPTNYVWNLSVDLAIEMGARVRRQNLLDRSRPDLRGASAHQGL